MSDGQRCNCDSCQFEFWSGHSHDSGTSGLVCRQCGACYCLPTKSHWGPDVDELIELHTNEYEPYRRRGRKKHEPSIARVRKPTGQHIMAVSTGPPFFRVKYVGVGELACTTCKIVGQIVEDLQNGEACPRCKTGKLNCIGFQY